MHSLYFYLQVIREEKFQIILKMSEFKVKFLHKYMLFWSQQKALSQLFKIFAKDISPVWTLWHDRWKFFEPFIENLINTFFCRDQGVVYNCIQLLLSSCINVNNKNSNIKSIIFRKKYINNIILVIRLRLNID
jgi:hypothetical protein